MIEDYLTQEVEVVISNSVVILLAKIRQLQNEVYDMFIQKLI